MPKITVHGGPSIAGVPTENPVAANERTPGPVNPPEDAAVVSVSVDGVDQGPGEVVEFEGEPLFEPLPDAVEGEDPADIKSARVVPDEWTVAELKAELDKREVQYPSRSTKDELVALLQADQDAKSAPEAEEASDG